MRAPAVSYRQAAEEQAADLQRQVDHWHGTCRHLQAKLDGMHPEHPTIRVPPELIMPGKAKPFLCLVCMRGGRPFCGFGAVAASCNPSVLQPLPFLVCVS